MLLEICTASVDDCLAAQAGGANRVELNSALMLGGLTPSLGMVREAKKAVSLPIIVMIRPRAGGFCYSSTEFAVMQRDLEMALAEGAAGIACGILKENGELDVERCKTLIRQAANREVVFHRAFDVMPDPAKALEQLIDLGVTRVMTSGQEANAYQGAANIARYLALARGRIQLLPAGGINRFTLKDVLARTGCDQVHASLSTTKQDISTRARPQVAFGGTLAPPEDRFSATDQNAVTNLRAMLDGRFE
jgi:copper homeostasis protein